MQASSLDYLKSLINAPSPSGSEGPVAQIYRDYAGRFADSISTDVHGNVTAILNPDATRRIMLSGHMDEIGFIIHHIDEKGLLYFSAVGGHDASTPLGQMVWVHGRERLSGAMGRKALHLLEPSEMGRKPALADFWIDIGATSRAEAEEVVRLGDYVTYQHEFRLLLGDRATGRAFDNKAGLFIVSEALRLLKEEGGLARDVGVYALGTVQEEIGSRGATTAASRINPQTGLAVDMEQALDYPGILASRHGEAALGKGPTLSKGPNTNPIVFDLLMQAAKADNIPVQIQIAPSTTPTDEKAMQVSTGGMATGLVGVALRYMHTPCEVVSLSDLEQCARLVAGYCRLVKASTDFTPF